MYVCEPMGCIIICKAHEDNLDNSRHNHNDDLQIPIDPLEALFVFVIFIYLDLRVCIACVICCIPFYVQVLRLILILLCLGNVDSS